MYSISSSDRKTSSVAIAARSAYLHSLFVETDGSNVATVIVYDNASAASGTILAKMIVAGASEGREATNLNVQASNGIYLSISGTGAAAIVHYSLR